MRAVSNVMAGRPPTVRDQANPRATSRRCYGLAPEAILMRVRVCDATRRGEGMGGKRRV